MYACMNFVKLLKKKTNNHIKTFTEPITEIVGGPELHINRGSTINLTCIVKFAPEPPPAVIWSHNRQIINFDSPRGGISLVTEKGVLTTSRLLVQKAIQADSGLYTCTPSNANPISVRVHIVDGEHPAAMHHGQGQITEPSPGLMLVLLALIVIMLLPNMSHQKHKPQQQESIIEENKQEEEAYHQQLYNRNMLWPRLHRKCNSVNLVKCNNISKQLMIAPELPKT